MQAENIQYKHAWICIFPTWLSRVGIAIQDTSAQYSSKASHFCIFLHADSGHCRLFMNNSKKEFYWYLQHLISQNARGRVEWNVTLRWQVRERGPDISNAYTFCTLLNFPLCLQEILNKSLNKSRQTTQHIYSFTLCPAVDTETRIMATIVLCLKPELNDRDRDWQIETEWAGFHHMLLKTGRQYETTMATNTNRHNSRWPEFNGPGFSHRHIVVLCGSVGRALSLQCQEGGFDSHRGNLHENCLFG